MTALQFDAPRFESTRFESSRFDAPRFTASRVDGARVDTSGQRVRLRLTRRGRVVLATVVSLPLIAALGAFALFGGGAAAVATGDGQAATYSYVTVQSGQSLWSIAQTLDPSADPRDIITEIVDLNQLHTSDVHAGQRLALPPQYAK